MYVRRGMFSTQYWLICYSTSESFPEETMTIMDFLHDETMVSYLDTTNDALMQYITKPENYKEMMKFETY